MLELTHGRSRLTNPEQLHPTSSRRCGVRSGARVCGVCPGRQNKGLRAEEASGISGLPRCKKRVFPRKSCLGTEWPPAPRSGGVPGDAALSPPGGVGNGGDSLISARKGPRIACKTYVLRKICEFLTALDVGYFFFTHRLWGRGNARPGQTLGTATIEE